MNELDVVYVIIAFCVVFAIVSAYVIYHNVQEEKTNYYKYRLRKEKAKENVQTFGQGRPVRKPALVVVDPDPAPPPYTADPEPNNNSNAALIAPVVLPEAPPPPALEAPTPPGPGVRTTHEPPPPIMFAAGGGALLGAAAFASTQKLPPLSEKYDDSPRADEDKKKKKKKNKKEKVAVSDFDDYRNGSPSALPQPKKQSAPAAASYTSPPDDVTDTPRPLPRRASRQGLEF